MKLAPDCPYKLILDDKIHWKLMQNNRPKHALRKMSMKQKDFYF